MNPVKAGTPSFTEQGVLSMDVSVAGATTTTAQASLRPLLHAAGVVALLILTVGFSAVLALRLLGYSTLVVTGGSMGHAIPAGSLAITEQAPADDITPGDVIVVQDEVDGGRARLKLHRVISVDRAGGTIIATTQGDANDAPDPKPATIDGSGGAMRVVGHVRAVGFVLHFIQTPLGWALAIIMPMTWICSLAILRIWTPDRARKRLDAQRCAHLKTTRTALAALVALAAGLALPAGVGLALFANTSSVPSNTFTTATLQAPSSLTATPVGHAVQLGWTAGQNGSGYGVLGVGNGTSSNCSSAIFASIGSAASTSYTDTGRYTPEGTWFCYQVQTTYGSWSSVASNPVAAAQLGFVATQVQAINGGTSGMLDQGDTIIFTFNQPVDTTSAPSGTNSVCTTNNSPYTIMLGSTATAGACQTTETVSLGKLVGGTSNQNGRFAATWAWSNNNKTLTVTIGTHTAGSFPTVTGTWTFYPTTTTTKLLSATGAFHACDTNTGGGNCLPIMTGGF